MRLLSTGARGSLSAGQASARSSTSRMSWLRVLPRALASLRRFSEALDILICEACTVLCPIDAHLFSFQMQSSSAIFAVSRIAWKIRRRLSSSSTPTISIIRPRESAPAAA